MNTTTLKSALVIGGSSGIGLAVTLDLLDRKYENITIVSRKEARLGDIPKRYQVDFKNKTVFRSLDLACSQYDLFDEITEIDTLVITAGFGRVAPFESLTEAEIERLIKVNELAVIQIIKKYYARLQSKNCFFCAVMGSIAGHVASPLFSVYGAAKMGLCGFIENVNAELEATGSENRILDVSPGSIGGTKFFRRRKRFFDAVRAGTRDR